MAYWVSPCDARLPQHGSEEYTVIVKLIIPVLPGADCGMPFVVVAIGSVVDYTSPHRGRLWDAIRGGSNRVSILLRGSVANKAAKQT